MKRKLVTVLAAWFTIAVGFLTFSPSATVSQGAPQLPPFPPEVPATAAIHYWQTSGAPRAQQAVWRDAAGTLHTLWIQNNPRCQVRIRSAIVTDTAGLPVDVRTEGTTCGPPQSADERFSAAGGRVRWQNRVERADTITSERRFYFALSDLPEESALLARALLAAGGTLPLWPAGEARIERLQELSVRAGDASQVVTHYRITGLDFGSRNVWLDERGELFARGDIIRKDWESALGAVRAAQQEAARNRGAALERALVRRPAGKLVIHGARVFDASTGTVRANHTVVISGSRIESVTPTRSEDRNLPDAIDAAGHTLLPGLWDSHGHSLGTARQNLAAGVTTIRVLAASVDLPRAHWAAIETGAALEPRLVPIALVTGLQTDRRPGQRAQNAGDPGTARTPDDVRRFVAAFAAAGYRQVKMCNELRPAWVQVMIDEARRHGLRASGHIPNDVTLSEAVAAGLQEVHHANFLLHELVPELRRLHDNVELPRRAATIDLNSAETKTLITLLRERGVTLDPTLVAFEERWTSQIGRVPAAWAALFERFPLQERRRLLASAPGAAAGIQAAANRLGLYDVHRRSFATMLRLIRMLSDAGVTVLPGTDNPNGFALHRDLELHVQAGIPPARVLQSATLFAARVMKLDDQLGSIDPGKLADLVLVEGDPTQNIGDIRRTRLVIKDGALIDVAGLYRAIGIAAQ